MMVVREEGVVGSLNAWFGISNHGELDVTAVRGSTDDVEGRGTGGRLIGPAFSPVTSINHYKFIFFTSTVLFTVVRGL